MSQQCQIWHWDSITVASLHWASLFLCLEFSFHARGKKESTKPKTCWRKKKMVREIGLMHCFVAERRYGYLSCPFVFIIHGVHCILPVAFLMHDERLLVVLSLSLSRASKERDDCISRSIWLHSRPHMQDAFFLLICSLSIILFSLLLSQDSTTSQWLYQW